MGDLTRALLLASCLAAFGCSGGGDDGGGSGEGDGDAGDGDGDTSEPLLCESDDECSDEVFCNGPERCNPEHADADAFGCLPAADEPCSEGNSCNEQDDACGCEEPDADGDGSESEACGGDDCDDDDANRYPGNEEVCDGAHHDEDCNPDTYGFRDQDGDEDPDDECCNEEESGGSFGGGGYHGLESDFRSKSLGSSWCANGRFGSVVQDLACGSAAGAFGCPAGPLARRDE